MAQGDIWELTAIQLVHNTRLTNVFYYRQEDAGDDNTAGFALTSGFLAEMAPLYEDCTGPEWSLICQEVRKVGVTGLPAYRNTTSAGPGTGGAECVNPATVVTIAQFTEDGSYAGTGRFYLSGIPLEFEQRNNLTQEGLAAIDPLGDRSVDSITFNNIEFTPGRKPRAETGFSPWILSDTRVILTKLRSRRADTKC